jgi:ribulose-5-phosphate 4-epimerase/fuculose-1-phosphate aldolase
MNEGYIKFNCIWKREEIRFPEEIFAQLESCRSRLYALGLIGIYPDGIGFGNLSARIGEGKSFIISGSATGGLANLKQSDYALVTDFNISKNVVFCTGLTKASSESLTHASVYESLPEVGAVVHVHCLWLWKKLLNIYSATSFEFEYGTPEIADAVGKLVSEMNGKKEKIIVMGGHQEGILAYGSNLIEATEQIIKIYNQYKYD